MSNAARKQRKRDGIQFEHKAKTVTPITERAWFLAEFFNPRLASGWRPRSLNKRNKALADRGLEPLAE